MKKVIINQAKADYLDKMDESPTKAARWTSGWEGMVQTSNEMSLVAIAHKITGMPLKKKFLKKECIPKPNGHWEEIHWAWCK